MAEPWRAEMKAMTHTSITPEMIEAAEEAYMPFGDMGLAIQCALAAAPGKPLTDAQIKEGRNAVNDDPDDRPEPWAFREGVKFAERMHGITQEKQG